MSSMAVTVRAAAAARAPAASQRQGTNGPSEGPSQSLRPARDLEFIHKSFLLLLQNGISPVFTSKE